MVHSVTKQEMLLLRKVDQKYQVEHGIHMAFDKTVLLEVLGSKKSSNGEIWLDQGKMRLEVNKPELSKVVADLSDLWIETAASADEPAQVLKTSLKSKQAQSQALVQLLTQGGVLKHFRVSGVKRGDGLITYFLQPDKTSVEFKRAQVEINPKTQIIKSLKYWDQMDNETLYAFKDPQFNKKLDKDIFVYKPPKGAQVQVF